MSNSTTLLDTILTNQANKEVVINALLDAASPATLWGRHASASSGLTWGYYGGNFTVGTTVNAVANGTVALTASTTNYLQASPTTGAVSANTTSFTAGQIPLYSIVTGASSVTSYTDCRSYQPSATTPSGTGTVTDVAVMGGVETNLASGADITATGTIRGNILLAGGAVQTAAYTWVTADRGKCLVMNNAGAVSQTLPTPTTGPTSNFPSGWYTEVQSIGAGTTTVGVPSGLKLDNVTNGTVALSQNSGCSFFTDGTNYFTVRGIAGSGGGSGTLAGLSDVSFAAGAGIDKYVLRYNFAASKWNATQLKLLSNVGQSAAFDPAHTASNLTLSGSNFTATGNNPSGNWNNARSATSNTAGKWYAEATCTAIGSGGTDGIGFGIQNASAAVANGTLTGVDTNGVMAFSRPGGTTSGLFYNGAVVSGTSGNFNITAGTTVGVAIDFTLKKVWFYDPVTSQWNCDVIANQNPATGTGGFDITALLASNGTVYLAGSISYGSAAPSMTVNGGASAFVNNVPAGFTPWTNNIPQMIADVTVTNPTAGQVLTYNGSQWINQAASGGGSIPDYVSYTFFGGL